MTPSPTHLRLQQAVAGDDLALAQLMRTHYAPLLRFGQRVCADPMDADDAVQEAFVKLARRPDLPREAGTLAWLFTVVRNRCLRFLRRAHLLRQRLLRRWEALASSLPCTGAAPIRGCSSCCYRWC
jgi:RNA polymerase sigma-70 factor (ECF subfamily)